MRAGRYTIPASETDEGRKLEEAYYTALGRFIDMFAVAEAATQYALRYYAKTRTRVAVVIFSGVRVDVATNHIENLIKSARLAPDKKAELGDILQHLRDINNARNNILHYGARAIAEGRGFVTNALTRSSERAVRFQISPEILENMTTDLRKIITYLHLRHMGRPPPHESTQKMLLSALPATWLYKHQPQSERPKRRVATRQRMKRRDLKPPRQP
jgi:hypothetical protein